MSTETIKEYFDNGNLVSKISIHGLKNGSFKSYWKNGHLNIKCRYKNGFMVFVFWVMVNYWKSLITKMVKKMVLIRTTMKTVI